jgi:hypothetical protein
MKSDEFKKFDETMETILRADPKAVKEAMEAEKKANEKKRKAKKSSASGRVASEED